MPPKPQNRQKRQEAMDEAARQLAQRRQDAEAELHWSSSRSWSGSLRVSSKASQKHSRRNAASGRAAAEGAVGAERGTRAGGTDRSADDAGGRNAVAGRQAHRRRGDSPRPGPAPPTKWPARRQCSTSTRPVLPPSRPSSTPWTIEDGHRSPPAEAPQPNVGNQEKQGGQGGQGGQGVHWQKAKQALVELKLMKAMQTEINRRTQDLEARFGPRRRARRAGAAGIPTAERGAGQPGGIAASIDPVPTKNTGDGPDGPPPGTKETVP